MEPSTAPRPPFAHASEAEFARILDFYEVRWEYEPHVFPILWNLDGLVVESFAPDFWLPDLELYIEMTTLKQSLVRKKNRKLRRLRELYPDIRIKLFYGRDFRALMLKYGQHGLIGAMSGTLGQSTPPRIGRSSHRRGRSAVDARPAADRTRRRSLEPPPRRSPSPREAAADARRDAVPARARRPGARTAAGARRAPRPPPQAAAPMTTDG